MSINLAEVPFKDLKKAVASINTSGLLDSKIKAVGVKKEEILNKFCDAIEELEQSGEIDEIPEVAFDFYNGLSEFEEDEEEDDIEEYEEDEDLDEEEDDIEEEEDEEEEVVVSVRKKPKSKKKKSAKKAKKSKKPVKAKKKKKEPEEEDDEPKARVRLATVRMSAKVEKGKLVIGFAGQNTKRWKMPATKDKKKIKFLLKKALEFAESEGATIGQQKAVRKAFTSAGYYMSK